MNVIAAGAPDMGAVREIAVKTWPEAYGHILSPEQITYMLDLFYSEAALSAQLAAGHHFLMGIDDHKVIGFASYELNYEGGKDAKLHKLYVLPDVQGRNAGRSLLEAVRAAAADAGQEHLLLHVNRYNKALGFYRKYGFEIIREEDINIGDGFFMNDYVMALPLA